jgi:hypothetical protein
MSTFDGSNPSGNVATDEPDMYGTNGAPRYVPPEMDTTPPPEPQSILDELRADIESRDAVDVEPWRHRIKDTRVRLACNPDIENDAYQRWFKLSLPRKGNGRQRQQNIGPADLDQLTMSAYALIESNLQVELLRKGADDRDDANWVPIRGESGDLLTLADNELQRTFNTMDAIALTRKLFGRDAYLIDAGQDLLAAAGYGGDVDTEDESNPTPRRGGAAKTSSAK